MISCSMQNFAVQVPFLIKTVQFQAQAQNPAKSQACQLTLWILEQQEIWMKFPLVFSVKKAEKGGNQAYCWASAPYEQKRNFKGELPGGRFLRGTVIREKFRFKEALS